MKSRPVAWITHPVCQRHEMEPGHPESPQRLQAIEQRLSECGVMDQLQRREAPLVTVEALERVHDPSYVQRFLTTDASKQSVRLDPDTVVGRYTQRAALRAAGAAVLAVDLVLEGQAGLAFCAVRPPGHHAERARAMGFCFLNNVAVAAAHALARGLSRVAILDFDVHYGNGTADIFKHDPRVLLLSTYQDPLYPFWTRLPDSPNLIDVALPPYTEGEAFRAAVTQQWLPPLKRFRPELILVSAGFDAHADDPLAHLRLQTQDYQWLGDLTRDAAEEFCDGRVVATLEGGYDLSALGRSVEAFLRPFLGAYGPPIG